MSSYIICGYVNIILCVYTIIIDGEKVVDVSCGDKHTLCCTASGKVFAFGEGEHGRLGTGHTQNCKKPVLLNYFDNQEIYISRVYASKEYSFILNNDGIPFGFGRNDRSQIGQGVSLALDMYSCEPTPNMLDLTNIISLSLSNGDVLCCDINGNVYNWGDRIYLEPTNIFNERFQDDIPSGNITNVHCTNSSFFFITSNGELFSCSKQFGMNTDIFTLGHGSIEPFKIPKKVKSLENEFVIKLVSNDSKTIAICK